MREVKVAIFVAEEEAMFDTGPRKGLNARYGRGTFACYSASIAIGLRFSHASATHAVKYSCRTGCQESENVSEPYVMQKPSLLWPPSGLL